MKLCINFSRHIACRCMAVHCGTSVVKSSTNSMLRGEKPSGTYILGLPRTTYCVLLHQICSDIPVLEQLYSRFINFIKGLNNSNNQVTNLCVNIALQGSSYIVSNHITIVSNYLYVSRYNIPYRNIHQIVRNSTVSDSTQVIKDLLDMKHRNQL